MKLPKLILSILFTAVVMISFASCDLTEVPDRSYDGPPVVEVTPTSDVVEVDSAQTDTTISVDIQLISKQGTRDSDLTIGVSVVDSLTSATQADFALSSTSATIPANSVSTVFDITVTGQSGNNLSSGQTATLGLVLEGSDGVEPAENLKNFDLQIQEVD